MDENDAAAFTICTEHHGKVRNRDLGYTNAGQLLAVPGWQWHILGVLDVGTPFQVLKLRAQIKVKLEKLENHLHKCLT